MSDRSDAEILAQTIMENWHDFEDGDNSPRGYYCQFCNESSRKGYDSIRHALDCPVLVAKGILTKSEAGECPIIKAFKDQTDD